MKLPGFTAEVGLEESKRHYSARARSQARPSLVLAVRGGFTDYAGCSESCGELYDFCKGLGLLGCEEGYERCDAGCDEIFFGTLRPVAPFRRSA